MEQDADVANGNQQEAEGGKKKDKRKAKKSSEASRSMSFDSSLPSSHTVSVNISKFLNVICGFKVDTGKQDSCDSKEIFMHEKN
jgi:hypothetical protein